MRYAAWVLASVAWVAGAQERHNALTAEEKAAGWTLLFDGKTTNGWIDPARETPPGDAWTVEDGCLKAKAKPKYTEDLATQETFRDFEMVFDWRISEGGNSGVKYRIQEFVPLAKANAKPGAKRFEDHVDHAMREGKIGREQMADRGQVYVVGFEYQAIDNAGHPDARRGPLYQAGALYGMVPPVRDAARPVGEWNHSRLVVQGEHVEHWLNGEKVVDTTLDNAAGREALAKRWGEGSKVYELMTKEPRKECPLSLQNHGDTVWFRDVKVRRR